VWSMMFAMFLKGGGRSMMKGVLEDSILLFARASSTRCDDDADFSSITSAEGSFQVCNDDG